MRHDTFTAFRRELAGLLLFALSATFGSHASAGLMNADFSSGFDFWSGEIATFDFGAPPGSEDSGIGPAGTPLNTAQPDNYLLPGPGAAKISTSSSGLVDTYFVSLFQDFTVDPIAPGSTLELSLVVTAVLTDSLNGAVQLIDNGGLLPTIDLTGGGSFDITDWVGASAQLALFVSDDDFTLPAVADMITIGDIVFTETAAVPEPGALLLFSLGFAGLLCRRRVD